MWELDGMVHKYLHLFSSWANVMCDSTQFCPNVVKKKQKKAIEAILETVTCLMWKHVRPLAQCLKWHRHFIFIYVEDKSASVFLYPFGIFLFLFLFLSFLLDQIFVNSHFQTKVDMEMQKNNIIYEI